MSTLQEQHYFVKGDNKLYEHGPNQWPDVKTLTDVFTDKLEDAAGARATLSVLPKHGGMCNAACGDEHVQEFWWGSPEHLLQELQSCCHHIVIPVLCVV